MIEMSIESIRVSLMNYQRVVILKEKNAERYLPIWIGPAEADAIAVRLQDVSVARPLTHDLLRSVIDALGAEINCIIVNDLANDTFYARIVLYVNGPLWRSTRGPAMRSRSRSGRTCPSSPTSRCWRRPASCWTRKARRPQAKSWATVKPEELEKMSAFRDFIESLDLDDFEKHKPPSSG